MEVKIEMQMEMRWKRRWRDGDVEMETPPHTASEP